ncbi:MAG: hypothetical protein ACREUL_20325 [Steroidobacteraceae bacterium]
MSAARTPSPKNHSGGSQPQPASTISEWLSSSRRKDQIESDDRLGTLQVRGAEGLRIAGDIVPRAAARLDEAFGDQKLVDPCGRKGLTPCERASVRTEGRRSPGPNWAARIRPRT